MPIAINIVKTNKDQLYGGSAIEDLLFTFRTIRHLPILYVAINVSCVNTPEGILQETDMLSGLLEKIEKENSAKLPILFKLSEDGSDELIKKNACCRQTI